MTASRHGLGRGVGRATRSALRPLLFLDVDGPLFPFGARELPYPTWPSGHSTVEAGTNPLLDRIDPAHGPRIAALPVELVWATTWGADANSHVAPRAGLPALPFVAWPDTDAAAAHARWTGLHWKTTTLLDRAAGRTSGSTTRSRTPTDTGSPTTTRGERCSTVSTRRRDSPGRTAR